jgi:two-component system, OmpR family, alkaline phosphatase synthesis response regulator PhoP
MVVAYSTSNSKNDMSGDTDAIEVHGILLRPASQEAWIDGRPLSLTKTEFRLLHFLASHAGTVHTRQQIMTAVNGADYPATERSVDGQIMGLRKRLGEHARWIESVRSVGYRLRDSRG